MGRFFSYDEILGGLPGPADILRVTRQITGLPAFAAGHAVVAGAAAWGAVSVRSDIDVLAYRCAVSMELDKQIGEVLNAHFPPGSSRARPLVDITWIGSEREELVERDNLVSKSAPILERRLVSEIIARTCARLLDHVEALARMKGDPWRSFADRYFGDIKGHSELRRDVLREYSDGMVMKWRQQTWSELGQATLSREQLEELGHAESFATHLTRLVLADLGNYPRPDRHKDVRNALESLGDPWGPQLRQVLAPLFSLGERCSGLVAQITSDAVHADEQGYYAALREEALGVDMDAVEELMWRYFGAA